ncbi:MAG: carbonic anhydrase, partial [Asticcacaulis sp.]
LTAALCGGINLTGCTAKKPANAHGGNGAATGRWSYDGDTGPAHWGQLCTTGTRQSPVDISGQLPTAASKIKLNYNSVAASIQNTGKAIRIVPQSAGGVVMDGHSYALKYIEFHSPSEHSVDGHRATLESQFVHEDAKGNKVIVAVLYDVGVADPMLASLWTYLPSDAGQPVPLPDLLINAQDLMPSSADFYVYSGSLTTPPCTEGVTWMIYNSPLSVSAEQADVFERLIGPNARPLQDRHDRDYIHVAGN